MNFETLSARIKARYTTVHEKWLDVILAIAIYQYIYVGYLHIKAINDIYGGPFRDLKMVEMLSYVDMAYLPLIFYMFYKRKRWGWILYFSVRLITMVTSTQYYIKDYLPFAGSQLFPGFLLKTMLDVPIVIYLWQQAVPNIFGVSKITRRWTGITVAVIILVVLVLSNIHHEDRRRYRPMVVKNPVVTSIDTGTKPSLVAKLGNKVVDTTYKPTGLYFLVAKGEGVSMRKERSNEIESIASTPFVSVKNVSKADVIVTTLNGVDYTELRLKFDKKGTKDLAENTGSRLHPLIAVIIANKLLYVVGNNATITTGVLSIGLVGYSAAEIKEMKTAVDNKR